MPSDVVLTSRSKSSASPPHPATDAAPGQNAFTRSASSRARPRSGWRSAPARPGPARAKATARAEPPAPSSRARRPSAGSPSRLQRAQKAGAVGAGAVQDAADVADGVDGADAPRVLVHHVQQRQDGFLVRHGDVDADQVQGAQALHGGGQPFGGDIERHIGPVQAEGGEGGVVHGRRTGVADGMAPDADEARPARDRRHERFQRHRATRPPTSDSRPPQVTARTQRLRGSGMASSAAATASAAGHWPRRRRRRMTKFST